MLARNRSLHRLMVDGVTVEFRGPDGGIRGAQAKVIDFDDAAANDWLAVNQFSVVENKHSRRPDVVLFLNGLPLGVHGRARVHDVLTWNFSRRRLIKLRPQGTCCRIKRPTQRLAKGNAGVIQRFGIG